MNPGLVSQGMSQAERSCLVTLFQGCAFSRLPGDLAEVSSRMKLTWGCLPLTQRFLSNNKSESDVDSGRPTKAAAAG